MMMANHGKRKQKMISTHNTIQEDAFFTSNQKYLNWFTFFSVFPLIKVGGVSITFFIFLIISYKFLKRKKKLFKITQWTDLFLILFLVFVFIAAILTEEGFVDRSFFSIVKLMMQYVYWVILALFVKTWIYHFDFYKLSKMIFFASAVSIVYYVVLNPFYAIFYPNSFAYTIVVSMPLGLYYVMKRFSFKWVLLISFGFLLGVLFSGSRMGTALTLFELIMLFSLGDKQLKKIAMIASMLVIPLIMVASISLEQSDIRQMKLGLADILQDYSPKIAHTLRMEENVFDRDKSFLQRKLMLQKTKKIFDKYPFFGVGPGNFTKYYVDLDITSVSYWLHGTESRYNRSSSQNSYFMILAESGIFALSSLMMVFLTILVKGFYYVLKFKDSAEIYIYIPFVALLFYGVILVTTMGTLFWFLLGLALTLTQRRRHLA